MPRGRKAQGTLIERVSQGAPARAAFDWDALPEVQEPTKDDSPVGHRRIDVEEDTPQAIKDRVIEAYEIYSENATDEKGEWLESKSALAAATRKSWRTQECGTAEMALEFVRLAKRYCEKREERLTFRGAPVTGNQTRVRYVVKPFEAKG